MAQTILLINGNNLNLLGTREPNIYGSTTLAEVERSAKEQASELSIHLDSYQSNWEGAIIDRIHAACGKADAIIINPAAFTHTSVAIRDALLGVAIPFIELHISNIHKREPWRSHSYFSDKAEAVICGLGVAGYSYAVQHVAKHFKSIEGI